jgi:hypothetical protein
MSRCLRNFLDIIFFGGENHFMSHFSGHFEGASTFLTPKLSLEMAQKVILPPKKNYIPQFLKQRDINS